MIRTLFVLYVPDDLSAPGVAEVDIEIGHRHAFRIKEALEKQTQSERVEIGDGERPGNYPARSRPAARAHRNIIVLCPFAEVSNDEEINGKAHLDDDVEFEIQPVDIGLLLFLILVITLRQPFLLPCNRHNATPPVTPFPTPCNHGEGGF